MDMIYLMIYYIEINWNIKNSIFTKWYLSMHNPFFKKIDIFKVFKYKIIVSNFSTIKTLPFNISREQVNKILVDKSSIF